MTRRDFVRAQAVASVALGAVREATSIVRPSVAITMDDFNTGQAWPESAGEVNRRLLRLFDKHGLRITMFVIGRNAEDRANRRLLGDWASAGHRIGNHTYSHFSINAPNHSLADFQSDMLKAERVLEPFKTYERIFRFPMLKEGNTVERRDGMREFLRAHGYRTGYVTVDASDWYYAARLQEHLRRESQFLADRFREPYVQHMRDRSLYYDGLAREVLGRSPKHTLLVHYSYLNACFLEAILDMYKGMGWNLIDSDQAYMDPVFHSKPQTLPAGESLIWALAKETGRYDSRLRYPGEDSIYEQPKLDSLGL